MSKRILSGVLAAVVIIILMGSMSLQLSADACTTTLDCGNGYTAWCSATGDGAHCEKDEGAGTVTCGNDYYGDFTWRCPLAV